MSVVSDLQLKRPVKRGDEEKFPVSSKNVPEALVLARLLREYREQLWRDVTGLELPAHRRADVVLRFRTLRPDLEDLLRQASALIEQGGLPFAPRVELTLAAADFGLVYEKLLLLVK